mmetsp:Transcript_24993/g.54117  ORF Transcript_24993/g.54117 Transcript_24993/m.54117 type:complete len:94 (+) Transcript_24993:1316-1597(+)
MRKQYSYSPGPDLITVCFGNNMTPNKTPAKRKTNSLRYMLTATICICTMPLQRFLHREEKPMDENDQLSSPPFFLRSSGAEEQRLNNLAKKMD